MTDDEKVFISMLENGVLKIDSQGLVWKCQKKHKEWDGYLPCRPRLLGFDSHGYVRIGIRDPEGITRKALAHRLVYIYHKGNIPEGYEINHKDGNKQNNRIRNLEAVTKSENVRHAIDVLGVKWGNHSHKPRHWKIPREKVSSIIKSKESATVLAERFGVTRERIYQIRKGA